MSTESLTAQLRHFAQDRDWEQFHTPKNLTMALSGEAGELLALFQWLRDEQVSEWFEDPANRSAVEHEMADVFGYLLRLADVLDIDLESSLRAKIDINAQKYPVELARGNALKYTALAAMRAADG
ncbi:nucleotide pyrophosphohydrolase [Arthrobacter globiformis]|uniref:nucleotide pyrophosphohydrolase n=1 Tax=Arthrobacter globiformis TaxID=1665 RepID=UPI000B407679|nr:nucleotide pyrophosphohydrolase [Arthrobacter globiformis]